MDYDVINHFLFPRFVNHDQWSINQESFQQIRHHGSFLRFKETSLFMSELEYKKNNTAKAFLPDFNIKFQYIRLHHSKTFDSYNQFSNYQLFSNSAGFLWKLCHFLRQNLISFSPPPLETTSHKEDTIPSLAVFLKTMITVHLALSYGWYIFHGHNCIFRLNRWRAL